MKGLSETRLSVQKLNHAVVSTFLQYNVSAVGISPCFGIPGLQAHGGDSTVQQSLVNTVQATVNAGLVPILHGDACLYGNNNAGILSGDTIMEILGGNNNNNDRISQVIFITDVDGVYTSDPRIDDNAQLIRTLQVDPETETFVFDSNFVDASGSTHEHDVTGGLKTKLASAATIAASGKNVTIVRCGSLSAEQALKLISPIHLGTFITSVSNLECLNDYTLKF